jgi:hypothetical protein
MGGPAAHPAKTMMLFGEAKKMTEEIVQARGH